MSTQHEPISRITANSISRCSKLPSSKEEARCTASEEAQQRVPEPQLRILAAEDDTINQKVLSHVLERMGFAVTLADNGREAIAALQHSSFDVVLMDVQMPEMDGTEATERIRAGEAGDHNRDLPIIAVTAHVQRSDLDRFLEAGMDDCAVKPLDSRKLREQILLSASKTRKKQ